MATSASKFRIEAAQSLEEYRRALLLAGGADYSHNGAHYAVVVGHKRKELSTPTGDELEILQRDFIDKLRKSGVKK